MLCCAFVFFFVLTLCLVFPMLPVSLDCPFLIDPSGFSNFYIKCDIPLLVHNMQCLSPHRLQEQDFQKDICIFWFHHQTLLLEPLKIYRYIVKKKSARKFKINVFFLVFCVLLLFCLSSSCALCPILPVFLDCPFLMAPLIFSDVYLLISIFHLSSFVCYFIWICHCT